MYIKSLYLENIRCIKKANVPLGEGVNYIIGMNGSGKSSLLESINILGTGRSFRTPKIENIKNLDSDFFTISSTIHRNGVDSIVGFRKEKSKFDIRINSASVNRLSELALNFSLITFHSNSSYLIEGEPQYRRKYLDWWLFYSNHHFYSEWQRYHKLLKQRNAALRQDISLLHVWEDALAESGEIIDDLRKSASYILMEELLNLINDNYKTSFRIYPGNIIRDGQKKKRCYPHSSEINKRIFNLGLLQSVPIGLICVFIPKERAQRKSFTRPAKNISIINVGCIGLNS